MSPATVSSIHGRRPTQKVAVLLNPKALGVTEKLQKEVAKFVPPQDLFLSSSLEDAARVARQVVEQGYDVVLAGGGDGTFVGCVNAVLEAMGDDGPVVPGSGGAALRLAPRRRPRFGILRLGTGNALATLAGAGEGAVGVIEDILRARSGDVRHTVPLHLLQADGVAAPFAGMGLDARLLADYVRLRDSLQNTLLAPLGRGRLGYFLSIAGLSTPALLRQPAPNVTLTNLSPGARQIAPDGRPVGRSFEAGEVLYQGPARFVAGGTQPYIGYGFTGFAHTAREPGCLQVRLTAMGIPQLLRHLPALWRGHTPSAGILDFETRKVRLTFDRPVPAHVGGDTVGERTTFEWAVSERPVDLLDYRNRD